MLLAGLLLLAWDWNRLRVVVNLSVLPEATSPLFENRLWEAVGAVLFGFTAAYRLFTDRYDFLLWFGVCVLVGFVGLVVAWRVYFHQGRLLAKQPATNSTHDAA